MVLELGLQRLLKLQNVDDYDVDFMFMCCVEHYDAYRTCKHCNNPFWVIGGSKLGFWSENWSVPVSCEARIRPPNCQNRPPNSELIFQLWFVKNRPPNCQIRPPMFLSVKTGKHSHFHLFLF